MLWEFLYVQKLTLTTKPDMSNLFYYSAISYTCMAMGEWIANPHRILS